MTDFGLVKIKDDIDYFITTKGFTGTVTYCSPERLTVNPNSDKEDSWALGVTLYQLATLEFPFKF